MQDTFQRQGGAAMRSRLLMCLGLALGIGAFMSCSGEERMVGPKGFNIQQNTTIQQCDIVDLNDFTHNDDVTSLELFGSTSTPVTLNVTAEYNSGVDVAAKAYDTDYSVGAGGCGNALDDEHEDTQIPASTGLQAGLTGFCADCDGILLNVPSGNFCTGGDNTSGGSITLTGFGSDYTWTIPSYVAADDDGDQTISLEIDGSQVGASSGQGNGSVEIVQTRLQPITLDATFLLKGSGGIDNIEICREADEPGLGRITGGGGWIGMTADNGDDVRVTHGFTLHCDIELSNNLEINWPGNKWHIEKEFFEAGYPICTDDPNINPEPPPAPFDTFEGRTVGKLNGVDGAPIIFILKDAGEPGGKNDMGGIVIWDVGADPSTDDPILVVPLDVLDHGNLQFHYDQPHGCNVNKC
jgi:hypothetical protein